MFSSHFTLQNLLTKTNKVCFVFTCLLQVRVCVFIQCVLFRYALYLLNFLNKIKIFLQFFLAYSNNTILYVCENWMIKDEEEINKTTMQNRSIFLKFNCSICIICISKYPLTVLLPYSFYCQAFSCYKNVNDFCRRTIFQKNNWRG